MYNVSQQELVSRLAEGLKSKIDKPDWSQFVKTGIHKERPPVEEDWWYMRAGSILRQVEIKGPVGVSKLRYKYGGRKNNGMAPEHFERGSGKIIRTILQQLEKAGLVEQAQKGVHKGRVLTSEGKSFLFKMSEELEKAGSKSKKTEKKPVKKKEGSKKENKSDSEEQKKEEVKESGKKEESEDKSESQDKESKESKGDSKKTADSKADSKKEESKEDSSGSEDSSDEKKSSKDKSKNKDSENKDSKSE